MRLRQISVSGRHLLARSAEFALLATGKGGLLAANALLMLWLANSLAVSDYGFLVTAIGVQIFVSRILMLGTEGGIIRLHAHVDLKNDSEEVLRAGFVVIRRRAGLLILVATPFTVLLQQWYGFNWQAGLLCFVPPAAIGTALADYAYTYRLAKLEYHQAARTQSVTAVVRLGLVATATLVYRHSLTPVLAIYATATLTCGLWFAVTALPRSHVPVRGESVRLLVRYSTWQGWANLIASASCYQGAFLLQFLGQREAAGIFGTATTISIGFLTAYQLFYDYLFSRLTRLGTDVFTHQIKRAVFVACLLVLLCMPVIAITGVVLHFLLNDALRFAIPSFYWVAASNVLLLLQSPIEVTCHYLLTPQLFAAGWAMRLGLIGAAGIVLAPRYGSLGAAMAQAGGAALSLIIFAAIVAKAYRARAVEGSLANRVLTCAE